MTQIVIDYAQPEETRDLFAFLLLMSQGVVLAPIKESDAFAEVKRVVRKEFPIVAKIAGEIVGALGLIKVQWWFNPKVSFLTDRWFFLYPQLRNKGVGAKLLAEAGVLCVRTKAPVIINGHLNRRNRARGPGIHFVKPLVITPEAVPTMDWKAAENRIIQPEMAEA